jgi:hypothetical protein
MSISKSHVAVVLTLHSLTMHDIISQITISPHQERWGLGEVFEEEDMNDLFSVLGIQSSKENSQRIARLERKIVHLERKVDLILGELGLEYEEREDSFPGLDEVKDLLRQGRKIHAIKVYRQKTGVGLREARDAVERIEVEER